MKHQGIDRVGREIPLERAISGCFDKKPFDSKNQARDWAARGKKLFSRTAAQVPYHCHVCGLFHLTSQTKEKQVKARARDWGAKV